MKFLVVVSLTFFRFFNPSPATNPTLIKRYACRPSLPVRLFIPRPEVEDEKTSVSSHNELRPLYFDIHGGGFAIGDATINDHFGSSWSKRTGMIVASLNYRKAPLHPFPIALHDIATVARSVIDDESLPIDKDRIIIGGYSAGGNLVLTASLLPELQGKIKAVVSYYPILDFSTRPEEKFANRLDTMKPTETLSGIAPTFNWGYVPVGQNRKDKLLSPCFAARDELPKHICMVGAQHDALCREARDMIYLVAGEKIPDSGWDEGFERDGYKWMLVKGVRHGFAETLKPRDGRSKEKVKKCDEMYASIHEWLRRKGICLMAERDTYIVQGNLERVL